MNASRTSSVAAAALLALAATACGDGPPSLPGSTLNAAILYGRVTSSAGAPVHEGTVLVETFEKRGACRPERLGSHRADTGPTGAYRVVLYGPPISPRYDVCLRVLVDPPADSDLQGSVVTGTEVRLVNETLAPYDSVAVDVTLPRRP